MIGTRGSRRLCSKYGVRAFIRTTDEWQSGGFAGLVRGSEAAAKDISDAQRKALERHAKGAAASTKSSRARDMVMYELNVDTDGGPVRLEFDETNVPEDLEALVKDLLKRAKPTQP